MRRREFLTLAAGAATAWPRAARAQDKSKSHRIGVLTPADPQWEPGVFRDALRALGHVEGANLTLDVRSAGGRLERLPGLAAQLVQSGVDVVVAVNTPGARAAIGTNTASPIVLAIVADPVALGFVQSMARPGGTITGVSNMASDLTGKRLALLKEAVPSATRIGVLLHPDEPIVAAQMREAEAAAGRLRLEIMPLAVRDAGELESVIGQAVAWRADGLLRLAGQGFTLGPLTARLALHHRLPTMLLGRADVAAGGLMSYFADHAELWRHVAEQVDRILKGAPAGDLPFLQPTKFDLVVNLRTARALRLELPASILARADEVID